MGKPGNSAGTEEERGPATFSRSTIPDVARAAGVSRSTAARVLGGYGYTSGSARARVVEAAERLGYRPNQVARSMVTGRTLTIGVVVADLENLFFAQATRAISDAAKAAGFNVILANTDEDVEAEREAVRVFLDKRVDGLIVAAAPTNDVSHLARARASGCPLVLLDRRVPALGTDTLVVDNFRAAHEAVALLVRAGHRRIALASNAPRHTDRRPLISSVAERIAGYRAALSEAGISYKDDFLLLGGWSTGTQARDLSTWRSSSGCPTAVLATDSIVALGVIRALTTAGLEIPRHVSLISFDNPDWTAAISPALTVMSQPVRELGRQASETLIKRILGQNVEPPEEVLLRAELIQRDSVSDPPT
jgi:LacI family transcriptional regulator